MKKRSHQYENSKTLAKDNKKKMLPLEKRKENPSSTTDGQPKKFRKMTKLAQPKTRNISFPSELESIESLTWYVKENQCILAFEPLGKIVFSTKTGREAMTLVCDFDGKVVQLLKFKPGASSPLQDQRILIMVMPCDHHETMKGLCLVCNGDCTSQNMINKLAGNAVAFSYGSATLFNIPIPQEKQSNGTTHPLTSHVSLLHEVGYTIHKEKAVEMDREKQTHLLTKHKKLSLALDLDHTLLHTINDFVYSRDGKKTTFFSEIYSHSAELQKYIHRFEMRGTSHFVKFRPRLDSFLERCSKLFEMHIFTHGERIYADQIAKMIDPNKTLFGDRVLSRDECPDIYTKTLEHIFPCSDNSVLVIDDKTDVWKKNLGNVIQIAPYDYFKRIFGVQADVNNAPGNDNDRTNRANPAPQQTLNYRINETTINDYVDDDELDVVYNLLESVHHSFFSSSNDITERDVKELLKEKKKKILEGTHILFSGVIPLEQKVTEHHAWKVAEELGAKCYTSIDPKITHLVARQKGTEKMKQVEKNPGVHVVHLSWLLSSLKHLRRVNEFDYFMSDARLPLTENFSKCKPQIIEFQTACSNLMKAIQAEAKELENLHKPTTQPQEINLDTDSENDSDSSDSSSDSD